MWLFTGRVQYFTSKEPRGAARPRPPQTRTRTRPGAKEKPTRTESFASAPWWPGVLPGQLPMPGWRRVNDDPHHWSGAGTVRLRAHDPASVCPGATEFGHAGPAGGAAGPESSGSRKRSDV